MSRSTITVAVTPPYDVVVGRGVADALPHMLEGATRVAVVSSESVLPFADQALAALRDAPAGRVANAQLARTVQESLVALYTSALPHKTAALAEARVQLARAQQEEQRASEGRD